MSFDKNIEVPKLFGLERLLLPIQLKRDAGEDFMSGLVFIDVA